MTFMTLLLLAFVSLFFSPHASCDATRTSRPITRYLQSSRSKSQSSSSSLPSSQQGRSSWTLPSGRRRTSTRETTLATITPRNANKQQARRSNNAKTVATKTETTTTIITWQEEFPNDERKRTLQQHPQDQAPPLKKSSSSSSRTTPTTTTASSSSTSSHVSANMLEPHTLRTDLWQVTMHWKRKRIRNLFASALPPGSNEQYDTNLVKLQFSNNGYVRRVLPDDEHHDDDDNHETKNNDNPHASARAPRTAFNRLKYKKDTNDDDEDDNTDVLDSSSLSSVGTWELSSTGLSWTLPLCCNARPPEDNSNNKRKENEQNNAINNNAGCLSFHGDFHFNPFGRQPKVLRGVVLLINNDTTAPPVGTANGLASSMKKVTTTASWFRPVVATFHAVGIGADTADLSYQDRPRRF
jgi:hypothetical protein